MEKNINWHEIIYEPNDLTVPCKRWGHKTVYIEDQIVLFGGFSDVTYLNDLWAYNIHTNKWRQIKTTGLKPQGKSNFTMHFDQITNQLLIFGGGGPNKRRFNKISLLNWQNKVWSQVNYDVNVDSNIPWERTYHSSQFKYPFLITFGGEGAGNIDLDDLWVFNILTKKWTQIKASIGQISKSESIINNNKIQGRKFHSTTIINNSFFVISGCRLNYSCLPNVYSIDLGILYQTKNQESQNRQVKIIQQSFYWKIHKLNDKQLSLIQKWGHSSETYNGKIYIFGGRNQQDYNDLIEFNPQTNKLQKICPTSPHGKLPKSRRRHSSCMIGSSMLIFGGFNQDYFNDLQYISLFECRDTLNRQKYISQEMSQQMIELQERMFNHFMEQMNKDKPQYDIQIFLQTERSKQQIIVKSSTQILRKKSLYFKNSLLYNQSSNPQRNYLTINLDGLQINVLAFQIINNYLIKDLLILPKNYSIKKLCELLICADYFQINNLISLIQNIFIIKVIDEKQNIDDVFHIAANWNMSSLLKVCAQKKIIDQTYFSTYSRSICLSHNAARLKDKYIQQMLMEIQFDQIQKGKKRRKGGKYQQFGKNIKQMNLVVEQRGLLNPSTIKNKRKKSFVEKVVQSFSKICSTSSYQQQRSGSGRQYEQYQRQLQEESMQQHEIKIFTHY